MDSGDTTTLIVLLILLLLSAFFSCSETALTAVNKLKISTLAEQGNKRAALVEKLISNPSRMISAILIGNNIVNLSASSITAVMASKFGGFATGIATGALTMAILIFGEITPKTIATKRSEQLAMKFAPAIRIITIVCTPLVYTLNIVSYIILWVFRIDTDSEYQAITEHELRKIVDVSHEVGVLENEEKVMINNVVDFGDSLAKDIMIPQIDMTIAYADTSYQELYDLFKSEQYSRIPICESTKDNIIGIITVKDLFFYQKHPEHFSIHDILRKPFFTYEFKRTSELFIKMRTERISLAIVLDEYGATAGMITIEDLIEEIVGEIQDEYDDEPENIIKINDNEYIVSGVTRLSHIDEKLATDLQSDDDDFESIAGYTMNILDHIPQEGESVTVGNITLIADRVVKNRVESVRIILGRAND